MPRLLVKCWDGTNEIWIPLQVDSSGRVKVDLSNINLNDIGDVSITAIADSDLLFYDAITGKWINDVLIDSDIPSTIARDSEVTSAISTHAGLNTGVHGVDSNYVAETSEEGLDLASHVTRHGISGGDPLPALFLADIVRSANFQMIPTAGGWVENNGGSGAASQQPFRNYVSVNGTAGSYDELITQAYGYNEGGTYQYITWNDELYLIFNYSRYRSQAAVEAWVHLAETGITYADLTSQGIGLVAKNTALYGESYGTSRAEHNLNTTLSNQEQCQVVIWHSPGNFVKWYINGVLKATESTSGKFPAGAGTVAIYLNHAIYDGGVATTGLTVSNLMQGKIWQAR
jgi:hypothetical protein